MIKKVVTKQKRSVSDMRTRLTIASFLLLLSSCATYETGLGTQPISSVDMDDIRAYKSSLLPEQKRTPEQIHEKEYKNSKSTSDLLALMAACARIADSQNTKLEKETHLLVFSSLIHVSKILEPGIADNVNDENFDEWYQETLINGEAGQIFSKELASQWDDYERAYEQNHGDRKYRGLSKREFDHLLSTDPFFQTYYQHVVNTNKQKENSLAFCYTFLKNLQD